jgi:predicted transcriptional regulator
LNVHNEISTIHIPIDATLRKRFAAKARRLGFPSAQAYIRVWMTAVAEGRTLDFGDDWGEPTPEAAARLNRLAEEAIADSEADKLKSYHTVDEFMADLRDGKAA